MGADEAKSIAQYLGEHFKPGRQAAGESAPASEGAGSGAAWLPDAPGKDVFVAKCFQCHGEGMWKTLRQDKRGWEVTIYPMIGRGAQWTEQDVSTMAQYLSVALGPGAADKSKGGQK